MLTGQQYRPHSNPPPLAGEGWEGIARKRSVRRTALWLALLAGVFYFGFIAMGIWRSVH